MLELLKELYNTPQFLIAGEGYSELTFPLSIASEGDLGSEHLREFPLKQTVVLSSYHSRGRSFLGLLLDLLGMLLLDRSSQFFDSSYTQVLLDDEVVELDLTLRVLYLQKGSCMPHINKSLRES